MLILRGGAMTRLTAACVRSACRRRKPRRLFAFIRTHRRIGLMLYNQGLNPTGPFRLYRFPVATAEIRRQLRASRFLAYTPEWAQPG